MKTDILIIGGGMVGMTAACLFAQQGMHVILADARPAGDGDCNSDSDSDGDGDEPRRVSAISIASENLFRRLEVWDDIAPSMRCKYTAMKVWDSNSAAKISFAAADIGQPCLGHIVDNRAVIAAMDKKLRQHYQVTLLDETEVVSVNADSPLRVQLTNREVRAKLLIGADGAHSRVRALCDIATRESDFAQDAIVATLATEHAHRATALQCFLATGPAAMLPLADGRCALVWSCARAFADEVMALDGAQFRARLRDIFGDALGDITACTARRRFKLAQHHAEDYVAGAVAAVVVGDAAHQTHPLAGLGANLGLLDVAALAEVVGFAVDAGRDIGQRSVLRRYARWRRGENAVVLAMMSGFNDLFASRDPLTRAARSGGMNLVDAIAPLKTLLANHATGLAGDIPAACRAL